MLSKRGSGYLSMFYDVILRLVVVFVFVFLPVLAFVNEVTTSDYFEMSYLSMDVGMAIDTLLASPNEVVFNYEKDMRSFSIAILEGKVSVYKGTDNPIDRKSREFNYIGDPETDISKGTIDPIIETDGRDEYVIPIRLSAVKDRQDLRLYNAREDLIE